MVKIHHSGQKKSKHGLDPSLEKYARTRRTIDRRVPMNSQLHTLTIIKTIEQKVNDFCSMVLTNFIESVYRNYFLVKPFKMQSKINLARSVSEMADPPIAWKVPNAGVNSAR